MTFHLYHSRAVTLLTLNLKLIFSVMKLPWIGSRCTSCGEIFVFFWTSTIFVFVSDSVSDSHHPNCWTLQCHTPSCHLLRPTFCLPSFACVLAAVFAWWQWLGLQQWQRWAAVVVSVAVGSPVWVLECFSLRLFLVVGEILLSALRLSFSLLGESLTAALLPSSSLSFEDSPLHSWRAFFFQECYSRSQNAPRCSSRASSYPSFLC